MVFYIVCTGFPEIEIDRIKIQLN